MLLILMATYGNSFLQILSLLGTRLKILSSVLLQDLFIFLFHLLSLKISVTSSGSEGLFLFDISYDEIYVNMFMYLLVLYLKL